MLKWTLWEQVVQDLRCSLANLAAGQYAVHLFRRACRADRLRRLYGLMAYTVARRTNEIGIRIALGARRPRVIWMVLREAPMMAVVGLAIGLPAAFAASRLVRSFLFQMKPTDPLALTLAVATLLGAAC